MERLTKDSELLKQAYSHFFDLTIVNNDIEETISQLENAIETINNTPQWVPVSWVYWQPAPPRDSPSECHCCGTSRGKEANRRAHYRRWFQLVSLPPLPIIQTVVVLHMKCPIFILLTIFWVHFSPLIWYLLSTKVFSGALPGQNIIMPLKRRITCQALSTTAILSWHMLKHLLDLIHLVFIFITNNKSYALD